MLVSVYKFLVCNLIPLYLVQRVRDCEIKSMKYHCKRMANCNDNNCWLLKVRDNKESLSDGDFVARTFLAKFLLSTHANYVEEKSPKLKMFCLYISVGMNV